MRVRVVTQIFAMLLISLLCLAPVAYAQGGLIGSGPAGIDVGSGDDPPPVPGGEDLPQEVPVPDESGTDNNATDENGTDDQAEPEQPADDAPIPEAPDSSDEALREVEKQHRKLFGSSAGYDEYPSKGVKDLVDGDDGDPIETATGDDELPAPSMFTPARQSDVQYDSMQAPSSPGEHAGDPPTAPPEQPLRNDGFGPKPAATSTAAPDAPNTKLLAASAAVALAVGLMALLWHRFAAFPLFSRIHGKDVLEDPTRRIIYEAIEAQPGSTIQHLSQRVGINRSTLRHHLWILMREEQVMIQPDGNRKRFYVHDSQDTEAQTCLVHKHRRAIAHLILNSPGQTQKEVCEAARLAPSQVHLYASHLAGAGLVKPVRTGRKCLYYPTSLLRSMRSELVEVSRLAGPPKIMEKSRSIP